MLANITPERVAYNKQKAAPRIRKSANTSLMEAKQITQTKVTLLTGKSSNCF
ncbi:hypothetical protein CEXT_415631, partial [Caerostris extrusa]